MAQFLTDFLSTIVGTSAVALLLAWLASKWIGSRIESSIKHEYDRLKVQYESEVRRRERAQLVAELLAEWMATPPDGVMTSAQRIKLNRLSFEATLWLPAEITSDLSRVLQHDPNAPGMFELLLRTRTFLSGSHALTTRDITQWDRDRELVNRGLPTGFKNGQVVVLGVSIEVSGELRPISEDELTSGFQVPAGSVIRFQFPMIEKSSPEISVPDIQHMRLVVKTVSPDEPIKLTLDIFPKDTANALNKVLFGSSRNPLETLMSSS